MKINPNFKLELSEDLYFYLRRYTDQSLASIIDVELIEVPPHHRTLKIVTYFTVNSFTTIYAKIPFTQFIFTNFTLNDNPFVLISNTKDSIKNSWFMTPLLPNCNYPFSGSICWGESNTDVPKTPYELISYFWNSKFSTQETAPQERQMFFDEYQPKPQTEI